MLRFHRRDWALQRLGWIILAILIASAMIGLFGGGPASRATLGAETDPLRVEYERFWRTRAPMQLRLHVAAATAPDGTIRVRIGRSYLEAMNVRQILPQPQHVEAAADHFTFLFRLRDEGIVIPIVFTIEPNVPGAMRGEVGLEHGPTVHFRQFVYP